MDEHAALYPDKPLWNGGIDDIQMRWINAQVAEADRRGLKARLFSHFPLWPEDHLNLWKTAAIIALIDRHPSANIWLDGHNRECNYGVCGGVHYVNLKAMLDTPETSYARLDFFADRVVIEGTGRQPNLSMTLR